MTYAQALTFEIRTGPPPTDRQSVDVGIVLGKAALPIAGGSEGSGFRRHVTIAAQIIADGNAGYFRLKSVDDRCIDQVTIGRFGDGADLVLDHINLQIDENIRVNPRFSQSRWIAWIYRRPAWQ